MDRPRHNEASFTYLVSAVLEGMRVQRSTLFRLGVRRIECDTGTGNEVSRNKLRHLGDETRSAVSARCTCSARYPDTIRYAISNVCTYANAPPSLEVLRWQPRSLSYILVFSWYDDTLPPPRSRPISQRASDARSSTSTMRNCE